MKKLLSLCVFCLMAFTMNAQRCAVLEFKAGAGISQADVDGISAIFITYFRPAGYTMVERTQIDRAIDEQGFQRSKMTENQMVRIGKILNVSKIVVGDVNIVMGQYNVDARVINVESGTIAATEGATFTSSSYRATMQSIAQKLANKIAITSGGTVSSQPATTTTQRKRTAVEEVYGFLKVFPNELGVFDTEPSATIAQINNQAKYGYNNWRLPSKEELSLLRANGYLGSGQYMTDEKRNGIVLLVTDGDDYVTVKAAEQERKRNEEERRKAAEEKARREEEELNYIDLGLPSGTKWKKNNELGYFSYDEAVNKYGNKLPTKEQFEELFEFCSQEWVGNGIKFTGKNGQSIVLQADGSYDCDGKYVNKYTDWSIEVIYWSRTSFSDGKTAYAIFYHYRENDKTVTYDNGMMAIFHKGIEGGRGSSSRCKKYAIRLVR